jgi:hypothetical protein
MFFRVIIALWNYMKPINTQLNKLVILYLKAADTLVLESKSAIISVSFNGIAEFIAVFTNGSKHYSICLYHKNFKDTIYRRKQEDMSMT